MAECNFLSSLCINSERIGWDLDVVDDKINYNGLWIHIAQLCTKYCPYEHCLEED